MSFLFYKRLDSCWLEKLLWLEFKAHFICRSYADHNVWRDLLKTSTAKIDIIHMRSLNSKFYMRLYFVWYHKTEHSRAYFWFSKTFWWIIDKSLWDSTSTPNHNMNFTVIRSIDSIMLTSITHFHCSALHMTHKLL